MNNYYTNLLKKQLIDPANPILAHDIGLYHYSQAQKDTILENKIDHWKRVISNWSFVLENEDYWRQWSTERSQIYKKTITDEHLKDVKQKIKEKVAAELSGIDQSQEDWYLEAEFYRELKTINLLKQTTGILRDSDHYYGYWFSIQLNFHKQIQNYFQNRFVNPDPLLIITDFLPKKDINLQDRKLRNLQLQFNFSKLGIAYIYLEQNNPQQALIVLTNLKCPTCELSNKKQNYLNINLPTLCSDDCEEFNQYNPAYSAISGGRFIYYQHAIQLIIGAHLALAYHELTVEATNIETLLDNIKNAIEFSQIIEIQQVLKSKIAELIKSWAEGLRHKKQYNEAIALVEGIQQLGIGDDWNIKLAELLNLRAVQKAEQKQWVEAVTDLRKACELNLYAPLYRENLRNTLYAYANQVSKSGNFTLANKLRDEAFAIPTDKGLPVPPTPKETKKEIKPAIIPEFILDESELAHPVLFDKQGTLKLTIFNEEGQAIMNQARQEAAAMGDEVIRPSALFLALINYKDGETTRLCQMQGVPVQKLQTIIKNHKKEPTPNDRLLKISAITQFDLWHSSLKILGLAWELAEYDQGEIGEIHLLYGVLVSRSADKWLKASGLDVDKMIEQAGWF